MKTQTILSVLRVLAWIALFGCAVNLGSQVISFIVSLKNPVAAIKMPGIDQSLLGLYEYNFEIYSFVMSFIIALSVMYLNLWYTVVKLLSKLNLKSPFTYDVSKLLSSIAYGLISIWLVGFIGKNYTDWVSKAYGSSINVISHTNEFLFAAGIVFIISQIFKHGIEIQEENLQTI